MTTGQRKGSVEEVAVEMDLKARGALILMEESREVGVKQAAPKSTWWGGDGGTWHTVREQQTVRMRPAHGGCTGGCTRCPGPQRVAPSPSWGAHLL